MKKFASLLFTGALIFTMSVGCDTNRPGSEPEPEPEPIETAELTDGFADYSLKGTSSEWTNLDVVNHSEGYLLIINSDEEMRNHVSGNYPPIDFSKRTLLLAYGLEPYQNAPDTKTYKQVSDNNYRMSVNLQSSLAPAFLEWREAILVEKLNDGSEVALQVTRDADGF